MSPAMISSVRQSLAAAESASGSQRASALSTLAGQLDNAANGSTDASKVRMLAASVRDLAR
jgi:hypothetical protein